ncbi:hypothetical protein C2845_PM05G02340 [Panicum miliaceum]|uniref:Uncharacterized protein n=1 Tax=Panicum miliaceum TaxID=4540 RepID=A0A3L6SWE2_PANMI|nr:hypothetical protein C2845_PM05G02340 [Panicum miliaceum]
MIWVRRGRSEQQFDKHGSLGRGAIRRMHPPHQLDAEVSVEMRARGRDSYR